MTAAVWRVRWRVLRSRRRLAAWNLVIPAVLLFPVALSRAAVSHKAAVYSVFVVFFAVFGTCIPLVRDRVRGWTRKVSLTGYGKRRWIAERTLAESVIDLLFLSPAFFLALGLAGAPLSSLPSVVPAFIQGVLAANLLGAVVAAAAATLAEAALLCGVIALFSLHFSGLFRSAAEGTWAAWLEGVGLFRPLIQAVDGALSRAVPPGDLWYTWVGPLAATAVLFLVAGVMASRLVGSGQAGR